MISRLTSENSLLLILDVQTRLLPEMWEAQRVERNVALLSQVARRLEIPVVVTEQNSARIGGTVDAIKEALGDFSPVEKMRFSGFPDAQSQIAAANRKIVLLCGLEAHICVSQTALDLIENGFTVFAVYDAISSRQNWNRQIGWERLKRRAPFPVPPKAPFSNCSARLLHPISKPFCRSSNNYFKRKIMHPLQILSDTITWAGKNFAYNLGFIPDDKLDWKPAPDAKSALQISAETVGMLKMFDAIIKNQAPNTDKIEFSTREEAQKALESASSQYAQTLLSLGENDLNGEMQLPFGPMPKMRAVSLPAVETIHHHGQIAYIQTLLGDTQSHFFEMGS